MGIVTQVQLTGTQEQTQQLHVMHSLIIVGLEILQGQVCDYPDTVQSQVFVVLKKHSLKVDTSSPYISKYYVKVHFAFIIS